MRLNFNAKSYWEKRLSKNFSLQGVGFLKLGFFYNKWMYKLRKKLFFRYVSPIFASYANVKILDIGSGTGFYIKLWKKLGCKNITASDMTETAVSYMKDNFNDINVYNFEVSSSVIPKEIGRKKYDIISAFDVLFHIVDDKKYKQAYKNISKLLKPNGFFIFTENLSLEQPSINKEHYVTRSLKAIENLLAEHQLTLLKLLPVFIIMNQPTNRKNSVFRLFWKLLVAPVYLFHFLGIIVGPILYFIDSILIKYFKVGPSTNFFIVKRKL